MRCSHCKDNITDKPIKQGDEFFCSLECANAASGYVADESEEYFEEHELEGLFEEE
ncbi:MAG: hypothetical protein ACE5FH_05110 [Candidatus Zixiibacteriota bacterium]